MPTAIRNPPSAICHLPSAICHPSPSPVPSDGERAYNLRLSKIPDGGAHMLPDTVSSVLRRKDRQVLSIAPDASVYEAIALMAENSVGRPAGCFRRNARRNPLGARLRPKSRAPVSIVERHAGRRHHDLPGRHRQPSEHRRRVHAADDRQPHPPSAGRRRVCHRRHRLDWRPGAFGHYRAGEIIQHLQQYINGPVSVQVLGALR